MGLPKSLQMSWSGIVTWSLLCGVFTTGFAGMSALVVRWYNEFAFRDVSFMQMIVCGAGVFVVGTLAPMVSLFEINWVEKEGPAKIADEIERRLKG